MPTDSADPMSQGPCTHCGQSACKNGQASVHVLDFDEEGNVHDHFVCPAVAEAMGFVQQSASTVPNAKLIESLLSDIGATISTDIQGAPIQPGALPHGQRCAGCGLTLSEFRKKGRVGCPRCYETFKTHILRLLDRVHGATTHVGRFPGQPNARRPKPVTLTDLRQQLERAVDAEDYEAAARLRDALRRLEEGADTQ
ncbi:MAG: UvrB/UvrC motif-containing protein [Planctomycetota bacterium]